MLQGVETPPLIMVCPSSTAEVVMFTTAHQFYYSHAEVHTVVPCLLYIHAYTNMVSEVKVKSTCVVLL